MSQGKSVPRVSQGLPWWLWILLVLISVAVFSGLYFSTATEDPAEVFQSAVEASNQGRVPEVRAAIARLEQYPEYEQHRKLLEGRAAVLEMRDPKAIELLEEVQDHPDLRGLALASIAQSYRRIGEIEKSVASLKAAIETDPTATRPRISLTALYMDLGALALAVRESEAILEVDPENSDARKLAGNAFWEMHDYEKAAEQFRDAMKTPGQRSAASPEELERYLKSLIRTGNIDLLMEFADENGSLIADDVLRAEILIRQGDDVGLKGLMDKVKEFGGNPNGVTKLKALGAIHEGDTAKANQILQGLVAITPRDQEAWELLRDSALKLNKSDQASIAQQNIDQLKELDQQYRTMAFEGTRRLDSAETFIQLGDLALEVGDYELVFSWYQRAGVIDDEMARAAIEKRRSTYNLQAPLVPLTDSGSAGNQVSEETATDDADAVNANEAAPTQPADPIDSESESNPDKQDAADSDDAPDADDSDSDEQEKPQEPAPADAEPADAEPAAAEPPEPGTEATPAPADE
ncbi:MAG: hypothetical protein R3C19_23670 [Planctomycetaceae bacterium]